MNRGTRQLVYGFELLVLGTVLLVALILSAPTTPPTTTHAIAFGFILAGLVIGAIGAFARDR